MAQPKYKKVQFAHKIEKFKEWLKKSGAQLIDTTNGHEVVRFLANGTTGVVYMDKDNLYTFVGEAEKAYRAFSDGGGYRTTERKKRSRIPKNTRERIKRRLVNLQGSQCFYCFKKEEKEALTIDHFIPLGSGGPNHLANYVLSCEECNLALGNSTAIEKVLFRDSFRDSREQ